MESPDSIVHFLVERMKEAGGRPISGTQIRELVRIKFPDFRPVSYGCVNLRDFLRLHAPQVIVQGRAGTDYVYVIGSSETTGTGLPEREISPDGASVWRTFASPEGPFRLFAERQTGELKVLPKEHSAPEGDWVLIPPLPAERHLELAHDFVNALSMDDRGPLETLLRSKTWWIAFFEALKAKGLAGPWMQLRREKILAALTAALQERGIPTSSVPESRVLAENARRTVFAQSTLPDTKRSQETPNERLRRVAVDVVRAMSPHQLRDLPVRLGDVLDVLS